MATIKEVLNLYNKLSLSEQASVRLKINKTDIIAEIESKPVSKCPFCSSDKFIKHGKRNTLQKYKCKSCCKVFTSRSGTSYHKIKKLDKFLLYKEEILKGYSSLKDISNRIGISIQTSFDWRHKILGGLKNDDTNFSGIAELDDLWFLYSQKGRKGLKYSRKRGGSKRRGDNNFQAKVLATLDRKSHLDLSLVRIGRLKKTDIERKISGKFSNDSIIVSDKHRSIASFSKSEGIRHISFKSSEHIAEREYHVQNVNSLATRLKLLINHILRGVSTKYLQSYANWFNIKQGKITSEELNKSLDGNNNSWYLYLHFEDIYRRFIQNFSKRTYRCPIKKSFKTKLSETEIVSKLQYI